MQYDYVVVGLGKTGLSCIKHLHRIHARFAVTDSRQDPPCLEELKREYPHITVSLGGFDQDLMLQAKELVVSQGVSYQDASLRVCQAAGIPLIGDIELFARAVNAPVIAITGSNAKSTVTTLVGECFSAAGKQVKVGGNLGIPALDLLVDPPPQCYVLELSNFQLEMTWTLRPDIACILNITPDHLDRYHHFEDYIQAKQRIYNGCQHILVNREDRLTFPQQTAPRRIVSFGSSEPTANEYGLRRENTANEKENISLAYGSEAFLPVEHLKVKGQHNWLNVLAALAIAHEAGLSFEAILPAAEHFSGLPHRCQWVTQIEGIDWYNDSKGTNIGATIAAITGLGTAITGKIVLIAGGLGKGADFTALTSTLERYTQIVILYGQDALLIGDALGHTVTKVFAASLEEAVNMAATYAKAGDIVLLSPACASWDMFQNFEHRGLVFCELVQQLSERLGGRHIGTV